MDVIQGDENTMFKLQTVEKNHSETAKITKSILM